MKTMLKILNGVFLITAIGCSGEQKENTVSVSESYIYHASMAQVYRWFQIYENYQTSINNQLDILSEDVYIKSGLGEARGHDEYTQRVAQLPKTWQNAHVVSNPTFVFEDDKSISLKFDVSYTNTGMTENVRSANLEYTAKLIPTQSLLPKFQSIEIEQKDEGVAKEFISAYPQNRILSLIHYWLTIIEDPNRKPEPAKEIFADDFLLNFSSGAITTYADFTAWLAGPASSVKYSAHTIKNFTYEKISDSEYKVFFEFDWNGILPNDDKMTAKTRHTWVVVDNPAERFARMKRVDVEVLEPFAVVK